MIRECDDKVFKISFSALDEVLFAQNLCSVHGDFVIMCNKSALDLYKMLVFAAVKRVSVGRLLA